MLKIVQAKFRRLFVIDYFKQHTMAIITFKLHQCQILVITFLSMLKPFVMWIRSLIQNKLTAQVLNNTK